MEQLRQMIEQRMASLMEAYEKQVESLTYEEKMETLHRLEEDKDILAMIDSL